MSPEEQLFEEHEHLVRVTVNRMFESAKSFANSKHLEYDDLLQYGRLGLWKAVQNWENKQLGTFKNFAIRNIKWSINRYVPREEMNYHYYRLTNPNPKNKKITLHSMSKQPFGDHDDTSYYDLVSSDNINFFDGRTSVEDKAITSIQMKQIVSMLKEKDRQLFLLRVSGLTFQEIGEHYGSSRQNIEIKFRRIKNKIIDNLEIV